VPHNLNESHTGRACGTQSRRIAHRQGLCYTVFNGLLTAGFTNVDVRNWRAQDLVISGFEGLRICDRVPSPETGGRSADSAGLTKLSRHETRSPITTRSSTGNSPRTSPSLQLSPPQFLLSLRTDCAASFCSSAGTAFPAGFSAIARLRLLIGCRLSHLPPSDFQPCAEFTSASWLH